MNILTFDIEEWALAESNGYGTKERYSLYEGCLHNILESLDHLGIKSTFFCTGQMASCFPHIVQQIHGRGHEIGCHSNIHNWLNKMTISECREDTRIAIDRLEQCIGQKVKSYRAPAFSIGEDNLWAFEILVENGIERDSSIFPARRDFGGFPNFCQQHPSLIQYGGVTLKEFPIAMATLFGRHVAYSGGGYFRFFPLSFVKSSMENTDYAIFYFHIGDLIPESHGFMSKEAYEDYFKEPGTIMARYSRYIKSNLGKKSAFSKMQRLVSSGRFISLIEADIIIDWTKVPVVGF